MIGIVTATCEGNACVQALEGATTYLQQHGYSVVIGGGEYRSRSEPEMLPSIPVVTVGYAHDRENVLAVRVDTETVQRDAGYRAAMLEAALPVDENLIEPGDWFVESGYEGTQNLLSRGSSFTALFAHSDRMAMGAIRALLDHGMRVPEDVALVGFNDISLARYLTPPLTTVHYPLYELGRICGRLVIRDSCGASPGGHR